MIPKFYQEIILAYTKSKACILPTTKETLLTQHLWGNKFFTVYSKEYRKPICPYFQNWTIKGIVHVKNLRFINGSIDENFIYSSITDQRNIYR